MNILLDELAKKKIDLLRVGNFLYDCRPNWDKKHKETERTAFELAAASGDVNVVKFLHESGMPITKTMIVQALFDEIFDSRSEGVYEYLRGILNK